MPQQTTSTGSLGVSAGCQDECASMIVVVNGEALDVPTGCTVGTLAPNQRGVAVAVNREIVPRSQWAQSLLAEGDRVEILEAAQGG